MTKTYDEAKWPPKARRAVDRFFSQDTLAAKVMIPIAGWACRMFMTVGNTLTVHGNERLDAARARGRGLLTFSNHVCLFDDPWLTACICLPRRHDLRWIAADALNFFGNLPMATFFSWGKCVPIIRGAGLDQPGMDFMAERLEAGEWVHVFPEGGRTRDPEARLRRPFKKGLGVLVQRSRPLLLPFHHKGMQNVLPIGSGRPRFGNQVSVLFGEETDADAGLADQSLEEITAWAEEQMAALESAQDGDDQG